MNLSLAASARRSIHVRALSCLLFCVMFAMPFAMAQTAHFSGGVVTLGSFNAPYGVAVDASGNVYVADSANNAVREILAVGGYTTVNTLGSGFTFPTGVAVDASGNVYVADYGNGAVKVILAAGGYTTVNTLGSGFASPYSVAVDAGGNVYVADYGANAVDEILSAGGYVTVNALGSGFTNPTGVAVDASGNVYVAELGSSTVSQILAAGGYTAVNTLGSGFSSPQGIAVDASGNVYVGDAGSHEVYEILAAGGYTTVLQLGSGFTAPAGVAVDAKGSVFFADAGVYLVHEIMPAGVNFHSIALPAASPTISLTFSFDTGGTISAPVALTQGVASLDFADAGTGSCTTNGTAHSYNAGDTCTVDVVFTPLATGVRSGAAELQDGSGNVLALGYLYGVGSGPQIAFLPGTQTQLGGGFITPTGIAADAAGNVFVLDGDGHNIEKETPGGGGYTQTTVATLPGAAVDLDIDGAGNLYAVGGGVVYKETLAGGTYSQSIPVTGVTNSQGMAIDLSGNIYISDLNTNSVLKWTLTNGSYVSSTISSSTVYPNAIAVDRHGNVYVADAYLQHILKETPNAGGYTESIAIPSVNASGIAVDSIGNLYLADPSHSRILFEASSGGTYTESTLLSGLTNVTKLALGGNGNLFISNFYPGTSTGAAFAVDFADAPSLTFASTLVGATSAAQIVTVANIGTAALALPVPITGTNPSISTNFHLDGTGGTACPQLSTISSPASLAVGASCSLTISFMPTASGLVNGALTLTDTNHGAVGPAYATHSLTLNGTATVPPTPTVNGVSPAAGPTAGGTSITILGTNLSGTTAVTFGGVPATGFSVYTPTAVSATAPAGLVGTVDVVVTTAGGTSATVIADRYTYAAAPTVTGISAVGGPLAGGTAVTITGIAFTVGATVSFGAAAATGVTFVSATSITANSPAGSAGVVDVTVNTAGGISATGASDRFTYAATPFVGAVSPNSGPTDGGTAVTITGTSFLTGATVSFGSTAATAVTVNSATSISATSPAGSGPVDVTVTTVSGTSATGMNDRFSYLGASTAVGTTVLTQSHATAVFTPVAGTGGAGPLTYGILPALPAGLSFSSSTGAVTGTPTAPLAAANYTVTVTDANNASATSNFSLTVSGAVTASTAIANIALTQNYAGAPSTPANGTGGTGTLTYGVSPTLPAGLNFSSSTGAIAGTPTAIGAATTYTVTVTDANGATAGTTFTLAVHSAVTATTAIATAVLTQNHPATAFIPVAGMGGTGTLAYTIQPTLPAGLILSTVTGTVGGTPASASATTTYTVTVTDANSATATSTFSLTTSVDVAATTGVGATVLTQNHAAAAFTPVVGSGGTGTLVYSVAPTLPAGLALSTTTGTIGGTPTSASAAAVYTVTVSDTNGATATSTFSLTTSVAVAAATGVGSNALTQSHAATTFTPVTGSGGTGSLVYSVSPALPAGLSLSTATGAIAGTPTAVSATTTYTVTVADANSASIAATFTLTVNAAVAATVAVASTTLVQSRVVTPFTPITASGGTGTLAYSVSPTLPAGLSLSSATGSIAGTPTVTTAATGYTVTVTDVNGATGTAAFSLIIVIPIATTTAIASSNLAPTYGSSVVLTATVTPAPTDVVPGIASFFSGGAFLGTAALNSAGVATLTVILPLGADAVTAVSTGTATYAGSTSSALAISVRATSAISFFASPTTQLSNNPIVLTAFATSATAGTVTGSVTFFDGSTPIATVAIGAGGQATYSSTGLSDGAHTLTASYSGDTNFQASVSTGAAIAINVANLNLALGADNNQTVIPGALVTYQFPLSPLVTSTFLYDVTLTATGLPPGATYTFSPALLPAGSAATPVVFQVQTVKTAAMLTPPSYDPESKQTWLTLSALLLLPLARIRRLRWGLKAMPRMALLLAFVALTLGTAAMVSGCGANGFLGKTQGQTSYTITIVATSQNLVRTSTVQLNLQ